MPSNARPITKPTKANISPPMAAEASANNNNAPSKKNKRVLITGANQGIGLHTALLLAREGGKDITIACRSQERAQQAVQQIQAQRTDIHVDWLPLDLASLESVQQLVERIHKQQIFFDVVVLNAGVLLPTEETTGNQLETTFQVNFLGHFLLLDGIIAHQCPARPLHVVCLTSVLHRLVGSLFPVEKSASQWPQMFASARRWKAYALSKFAAALLAQHLNQLQSLGLSAVAVHPGNVRTQMAQGVGSPRTRKLLFFLKRILIEPEVAAANVVFCVKNQLGQSEYRHEHKTRKFSAVIRKQRNLDSLLEMSREMTKEFRTWESPKLAQQQKCQQQQQKQQ